VTAYGVQQRLCESGVRLAPGADRSSVITVVLREAFWQIGIRQGMGIPAAVRAGYPIASQLLEAGP
jgi:hypothetical protein